MASCLIRILFSFPNLLFDYSVPTLGPRAALEIAYHYVVLLNVPCTASRRSALTQAPSAYPKSTFVHNITNRKHTRWCIISAYKVKV